MLALKLLKLAEVGPKLGAHDRASTDMASALVPNL